MRSQRFPADWILRIDKINKEYSNNLGRGALKTGDYCKVQSQIVESSRLVLNSNMIPRFGQ